MFGKLAKGAETPRFRRGTEPPPPLRKLRPCLADDKPAVFHRWVEDGRELFDLSSGTLEKTRRLFALVEYPDGSVGKVTPELITFLDRKEG